MAPEGAPPRFHLEVLVGGDDEADVDVHGAVRSHRGHLLLLDGAEELALEMERHLPDLVEEESAPARHLEVAAAVLVGSREGALARAEELGLEELGGNGRAVHGHEGAVAPRPREVHGASEQLLAHARLPMDEYGGVEIHHGLERLEYREHGRALRYDVAEGEALLIAPDGAAIGGFELLELDGPADDQQHLRHLEGLDQVVLRPQPHRLHRGLDRAVGRHDHHREIGVLDLELAQEGDPVHAGQAPVREHQVHVLGLEGIERLLAALHRHHLVAAQLEGPMKRPEKHFVVVDQEQPLFHDPPPARGCAIPTAGSEMRTRVPRPGELSRVMSPLWRSTIFLTMAMPRPVPEGLVVKKGRKILSRSSGPMPTPLSPISTTARSSSRQRLTATRLKKGMAPTPPICLPSRIRPRRVFHHVGEALPGLLPVARPPPPAAHPLLAPPAPRARPSAAADSTTGSRIRASSKSPRSSL